MVSPTSIRNFLSLVPRAFFAWKMTTYSPAFSMAPVMLPVFGSSFRPSGRLSTAYCIGRSPVAGIWYRNGCSGRTPKMPGPLMCGVCGAGGVRISGVAAAGASVWATALRLTAAKVIRKQQNANREQGFMKPILQENICRASRTCNAAKNISCHLFHFFDAPPPAHFEQRYKKVHSGRGHSLFPCDRLPAAKLERLTFIGDRKPGRADGRAACG